VPLTGQPLYVVKIWRMGSSVVFPLYKLLLDAIHAGAGDLLLIRVHPPYVTFKVAHPELMIPVERFTREELPEEPPAMLRRIDSRSR
jgi:hypothetical protein